MSDACDRVMVAREFVFFVCVEIVETLSPFMAVIDTTKTTT